MADATEDGVAEELEEIASFLATSGGPDVFPTIYRALSVITAPFPNFYRWFIVSCRDMPNHPTNIYAHSTCHSRHKPPSPTASTHL